MHYLVTGGCGFIGSHVCETLIASGHQVTVLDDLSSGNEENLAHIKGVSLIRDSITTPGIFKDIARYDGVFHLAAIASVERCRQEWYATHQVNLGGTVQLFSAISQSGKNVPVVYASSAAVYGDNPEIPLAETARPAPLSPYGMDKFTCEKTGRIGNVSYGLGSVGLRFFNVYGARQDPKSPYSGVVSIFLDKIKPGLPVTIYGDGKQTRDFVYVGDVVEALMRSMALLHQKPATCEVLNVCTGKETSVLALATLLGGLYHKPPEIRNEPGRSGDIRHSCGNPERLRQVLGFVPSTELQEGLRSVL